MQRTIGLWNHYPEKFRELVANGMAYDYSWNRPGQDYLVVYDRVRYE
jgi:starch synthase